LAVLMRVYIDLKFHGHRCWASVAGVRVGGLLS
jgi:hypothetical protein